MTDQTTTDLATLGIHVDTTKAVEAMDQLTAAVERAQAALAKLACEPHGGIKIVSVGDVTEIEVAPAA